MENTNEHKPGNHRDRKISEEIPRKTVPEKSKKVSGKDPEEEEKSGFMKIIKKVGFSVWLAVMIIGAGLAFIASILLL